MRRAACGCAFLFASPMDLDAIRAFCLALPGATENIQWQDDLLFRVGGKIFAIVNLEPASPHRMSFKCDAEGFAELLEREGVSPAPYVGRYKWVALARLDTLPAGELRQRLRASYEMVAAKLPRKRQKRRASRKRSR